MLPRFKVAAIERVETEELPGTNRMKNAIDDYKKQTLNILRYLEWHR